MANFVSSLDAGEHEINTSGDTSCLINDNISPSAMVFTGSRSTQLRRQQKQQQEKERLDICRSCSSNSTGTSSEVALTTNRVTSREVHMTTPTSDRLATPQHFGGLCFPHREYLIVCGLMITVSSR